MYALCYSVATYELMEGKELILGVAQHVDDFNRVLLLLAFSRLKLP